MSCDLSGTTWLPGRGVARDGPRMGVSSARPRRCQRSADQGRPTARSFGRISIVSGHSGQPFRKGNHRGAPASPRILLHGHASESFEFSTSSGTSFSAALILPSRSGFTQGGYGTTQARSHPREPPLAVAGAWKTSDRARCPVYDPVSESSEDLARSGRAPSRRRVSGATEVHVFSDFVRRHGGCVTGA